MISTFNHLPDIFVLAEFCSDVLASKTLVNLPLNREEQTSFVQQDVG